MHGSAVVLEWISAFFVPSTSSQTGHPFSRNGVISRNHGPGMAVIKAPPVGVGKEDPLQTIGGMDPVDNRQSRRASAASGLACWAGGEGRQGSDTWSAWQHGRCMARARTSPPKRARRGLEPSWGSHAGQHSQKCHLQRSSRVRYHITSGRPHCRGHEGATRQDVGVL
jgi:hypothetical protein